MSTIETRAGLRFSREFDGTVYMRVPGLPEGICIQPGEWAAVLAAVSARGNTDQVRAEAVVFHQQNPAPELPALADPDDGEPTLVAGLRRE
jgi:hypothetical protein